MRRLDKFVDVNWATEKLFFEYVLMIYGFKTPSTVKIEKTDIDFGPNMRIKGVASNDNTRMGLVYNKAEFLGYPADTLFCVIAKVGFPPEAGMTLFVKTAFSLKGTRKLILQTAF